MKNINWYKVTIFVLLGILLLLLIRGCGKDGGSFFSCNKRDTISVKVDTFVKYLKGDTVYVPKVDSISYPEYKDRWYTIHDTLETFEAVIKPADTALILRDYYATRFYSDTQNLVRGSVIISDSVNRNRITSRRLQSFGTDTTIRETITINQPKRLMLFFGVSASGNRRDIISGVGGDLSLKGKNDRIYGVGVRYLRDGTLYYEAAIRFPIRLFKK
jgi:hypothetical protein